MKYIQSSRLRCVLRIAVPFVFIPTVIITGTYVFRGKLYSWVALCVALLSLFLFYAGFEGKTIGTRRTVIISVMTALSVLGRFVFAPLPAFKPITAMVIITAIWLGPESGFLVGSLSALISNFYFGQGPWTPFQMLSWGLIGLVGGYLSVPLKKSRIALSVYGAAAGAVFSLIMDVWSVLWYSDGFSPQLYLASVAASLPHMAVYSISNVIFLLLLGRPFGEKLERVRIKYRI